MKVTIHSSYFIVCYKENISLALWKCSFLRIYGFGLIYILGLYAVHMHCFIYGLLMGEPSYLENYCE